MFSMNITKIDYEKVVFCFKGSGVKVSDFFFFFWKDILQIHRRESIVLVFIPHMVSNINSLTLLQSSLGCCITVTFWHLRWSISFIKCSTTLHLRYVLIILDISLNKAFLMTSVIWKKELY